MALAPTARRGRIGDLLVQAGLARPEQIEAALERQKVTGTPLGELLLQQGVLSDAELAAALSYQLDTPLVDLGAEASDESALHLIPEELAKQRYLMPLREENGELLVAMAFPSDTHALDELRAIVKRPIRPLLALHSDIELAIDQRYHVLDDLERHIARFAQQRHEAPPQFLAPLLTGIEQDAPIVQTVNLIFTQALRDRASDIHIEPQETLVRVRFRVDGTLHDVADLPRDMGPSIASRLKVMANLNIVEKRRSQDGQIQVKLDEHEADVRLSTIETIWGEKVVLRILDKSRALLDVQDLGMETGVLERYAELLKSPFGMLLVCGPTGSGKTTTLYASINELDRVTRNVMTIEDPIEYVIERASQVPINPAAGRTFATGLRSILRQDPDVILVGEIRDNETVAIAMNAALTGHLVLSSLHAIDAVGAIYRLLDLGVERFMVTSSVVAVVAQRLVRKLCTHCRYQATPNVLEAALLRRAGMPAATVWRGKGCQYCSGTGYYGRTGVYELLILSEAMRAAINEGGSSPVLRQVAASEGLVPLREAGLRKVADGTTTMQEVIGMLQGAS
ncbi:MAG TPA: ATPase, T2SS/T4P/T4SS family [Candidatus Limnocylindria bacterium]|nr:ATPase, T2SS/T4P/T4SS family [Candidatus Limnocylindria bacterium]